jgi:5-methylthioribose kinase
MTPEQATAHVEQWLGDAGPATELTGGALNFVYRVPTSEGSVVVKHAAPHIRSDRNIRLDPARAGFEADALRWMAEQDSPIRTPKVLDYHSDTLILEDLGDAPDLARYLADGGDPAVLDALAAFLGWLHGTEGHRRHNADAQASRLQLQYAPVIDWLTAAGIPDADALGARAVALGQKLLEPGDCFVMGDLWPPSIRVDDGLQLIDWELSTVGRRAQDLGHLAAHLWMGGHRGAWASGLAERFLAAYGPLDGPDAIDVATHMGCEILMRACGPFRAGGPYDGLTLDSPELKAAIAMAAGLLRGA